MEYLSLIYIFNTSFIFIEETSSGIYITDPRNDCENYIFLPKCLYKFVSEKKYSAPVVMAMDEIVKGSYESLMMENYK